MIFYCGKSPVNKKDHLCGKIFLYYNILMSNDLAKNERDGVSIKKYSSPMKDHGSYPEYPRSALKFPNSGPTSQKLLPTNRPSPTNI